MTSFPWYLLLGTRLTKWGKMSVTKVSNQAISRVPKTLISKRGYLWIPIFCVCGENKTYFHISGFTFSLALNQRLRVTCFFFLSFFVLIGGWANWARSISQSQKFCAARQTQNAITRLLSTFNWPCKTAIRCYLKSFKEILKNVKNMSTSRRSGTLLSSVKNITYPLSINTRRNNRSFKR